jgi:uncharacterized membrane protein
MPTSVRGRVWELDAFRGYSVVIMVLYHLAWDLRTFGVERFEWLRQTPWPPWQVAAAFVGAHFVFVAGLSWSIRRALPFREYARPGLRVAAGAALITAITWALTPTQVVHFGVLHCLAVTMLFAHPLMRLSPAAAAALGIATLAVGAYTLSVNVEGVAWVWLGFYPPDYPTADIFPLFPWAGVAFIGTAAGRWLRLEQAPRFLPPRLAVSGAARALGFLGRHSLLIYLVHIPLLLLALRLCGLIRVHWFSF